VQETEADELRAVASRPGEPSSAAADNRAAESAV